jgi:TolB-like protein/Tfp pilus assembly protein PilF
MDLAKLPDWIGPTTLGLLAVGFPIALTFSWFYEITPEGISLEKDVERSASLIRVTGRRLDFIVISLLCAAVILFAYDKWWMGGPPEKSIAVLPFVDMSPDKDQEYFSDGIAEELLNLLTKIPELRVISRSSAFSFKGQNLEIPEIARRLNVAHILEGSVRKAGNRVRITVQLIEAHSDTHLWSETYDRTLDDIFAIQDEIAVHAVGQLKVTLLGAVPTVEQTDPEAYALYLQARHLLRQGTPEATDQSTALLERALAIDPNYTAAWVGLATAYGSSSGLPREERLRLSREAANQALAIDPAYAGAHASLGLLALGYDNDMEAAARHLERALALEPTDRATIHNAAIVVTSLGRLDEAIALNEYGVARDPVNPIGHYNLCGSYLFSARLDEAIASCRTALTLSPGRIGAQYAIGVAQLLKGEPEAALAAFAEEGDEENRVKGTAMALHDLGRQAEYEAAFGELAKRWGEQWPLEMAQVYAWTGNADAAFALLDEAVAQNEDGLIFQFRVMLYTTLHDDPRWAAFRERTGTSEAQLAAIEFDVSLPE